jgi:DNA repair exonuclease SbcCD ATPase subunit
MENSPDDDTHSRASTLGGEEQDFEFPEKTPTLISRKMNHVHEIKLDEKEASHPPPPHVPGPLEAQLAGLMSKLVFMERENPVVSVTPEDYDELIAELKALREEKKTWQKRHEALFALRDEDVENNIKIRGMLAKARRELEGMTKLRDEDLVNVQVVRSKLAEATRKIDRLEAQGGRASPSRGGRPGSMMMDRRGTMDLFAAAKAAALEQRALELEQRNLDLQSQIETLKGGTNIDDLNRMTAHKAWKGTVAELETRMRAKDAEIARLRSGASAAGPGITVGSGAGVEWHRVESIHEEHASYREKVGAKMQVLRSEKEVLQKELHRKEDENHALEVKVQSLQRRIGLL